ncbi:ferric reductase-like transmembrane component [Rhypophila decipiens]
MLVFSLALLASTTLSASPVLAAAPMRIIGYGFLPYDPLCAQSCWRSFASGYQLSCTPTSHSHGGHGGHGSAKTPPECFAQDDAYLTSVAWCFSQKCGEDDAPISKLEKFWEDWITGGNKVAPKWPYSVALENARRDPPTYELTSADKVLNQTSLVNPTKYLAQWNIHKNIVQEGILESHFGLAITIASLGLPVALPLLGYLPFMSRLIHKVNPYLVFPSLISNYQVRPLPYLLGNAPTIGQTLYIILFISLNVILSSVGFQSRQPNGWFSDSWSEISAYVLYRTGTLGLVLLPILFLFSARNNLLLWLTNWSHATFLLLHRWVARVFMLYVVVHSIIGLQYYAAQADETWWIWGAVATIATVFSVLFSGLYVRKARYELFLISHILLAVFIVVGSWYHVILWYKTTSTIRWPEITWGYELWIYVGIGVWAFDRFVRIVRVLKAGVRKSKVTDLGAGYIRIDVPGVRWGSEPGKHVYAFFPTLGSKLRPWENHPFSIIPTYMLQKKAEMGAGSHARSASSEEEGSPSWSKDEEKQLGAMVPRTNRVASGEETAKSSAGITLLVKKEGGITKHLKADDGLITLVDGPYSNITHTSEILGCDRLLLIAGGIGITGVLPWAHNHWNTKLAWSVSDSARTLVDNVELSAVAGTKDVRVGRRFNVDELVSEEAAIGWHRVGVVVSGPGGLCDDVRAAVVKAGRKGKTVFELEVDAYSW